MDEFENSKVLVSNPWQNRKEIGFFKSIILSIKILLFKPEQFFNSLKVAPSVKEPLLFYFCVHIPIMIINFILTGLTRPTYPSLFKTFVISFILLITFIYLFAWFTHFFAKLFRGEGNFFDTFHILAYASAAGSVFSIVPYIGTLISGIWVIFIVVIGLHWIHKFSKPKAFFVYVLSLLVPGILISLITAFLLTNIKHHKKKGMAEALKRLVEQKQIEERSYMYPKLDEEIEPSTRIE